MRDWFSHQMSYDSKIVYDGLMSELEDQLKCKWCKKPFTYSTNLNIINSNKMGLVIIEMINKDKDEYYCPDADTGYCKSCEAEYAEELENTDSRGQGQICYD